MPPRIRRESPARQDARIRYEVYLDRDGTAFALADVRPLLEILWQLLPAQYTGGAPFAEWVEQA